MHKNPSSSDNGSHRKTDALEYAQNINYTLYDISNAIRTKQNPEQLYDSVYRSLNKLITLPNFYIALYDPENRTIKFEYFVDEFDNDFPIIENQDTPNCLTGEVILAGRPLFLKENMLIERARKAGLIGTIPKIWIGIPLIVHKKVIGTMAVQHYSDAEYFSHQHLEIFTAVSEQIAVAIERQQAVQDLENNKKAVRMITDITRTIAHDLNRLLSDLSASLESLDADRDEMSGNREKKVYDAKNASHKALLLVRQLQEAASLKEISPAGLKPTAGGRTGSQADKNARINSRNRTVLVIDDEEMVRDMAVKALKSFGYTVIDAPDGESGIAVYQKNHHTIDAVLLDIIMPKMSGVETFRRLLQINPDIKVIIASGHITHQEQKKLFAKACAHLDKPYRITELKQVLERIL